MKKLMILLIWQWILILGILVMVLRITDVDVGIGFITGNAVSSSEDTGIFAPPYDAFSGQEIVSLRHTQTAPDSFEVQITVDHDMVFTHLYYYSRSGWNRIDADQYEWMQDGASVIVEESYTNFDLVSGDDFFVGVWTCRALNGEWKCGCKNEVDCQYWHIQGIDLEAPPVPCVDGDADGYGISGDCTYFELDCNDDNTLINPGSSEVLYNGVDDDCDVSTIDDDIDMDGFVVASDCDDADNTIHPSASDICGDGSDQNCDGADVTCQQCGEGSIPSVGCECENGDYYTGFCCDNTYRLSVCGSPEVVFYDGFESGTANTWDYLNPFSAVNKDNPFQGEYALNLQYTPGAQGSLNYDQYASTDMMENRHIFVKWNQFFEPDFIQPVDGVYITSVGSSGWLLSLYTRRWQGSTNQGRLWLDIDGAEIDGGVVLNNNHWYCMELEVFSNNDGVNNGVVRGWVDGTSFYDQNSVEFSDGSEVAYYKQGGFYDGGFGSVPIHSYVDNVVISTERIGC